MTAQTQSARIGLWKLSDYPEYLRSLTESIASFLLTQDAAYLKDIAQALTSFYESGESFNLMDCDALGNLGEETPGILFRTFLNHLDVNPWSEQEIREASNLISSNRAFLDISARHLCVRVLQSRLLTEGQRLSESVRGLKSSFENINKPDRSHLAELNTFSPMVRELEIYALGLDAADQNITSTLDVYTADSVQKDLRPDYLNDSCKLLLAHASIQMLSAQVWRLANDFRLKASGPRGGFKEIVLPAVAPGSSIMPGKLNPVMAEMVYSTSDQVDANHASITLAIKSGWLESTATSGIILRNFIESSRLLARTIQLFNDKCISGIRPLNRS